MTILLLLLKVLEDAYFKEIYLKLEKIVMYLTEPGLQSNLTLKLM